MVHAEPPEYFAARRYREFLHTTCGAQAFSAELLEFPMNRDNTALVVLPDATRADLETALLAFSEAHGKERLVEQLRRHGISGDDLRAVRGQPVLRTVAEVLMVLAGELQGFPAADVSAAEQPAPRSNVVTLVRAEKDPSGGKPRKDDRGGEGQADGDVAADPNWPFRIVAHGVEKRIEYKDKKTDEITSEWKWFCSRLEVVAETRDGEGENWGRLVRITDRDAHVKEWAMPMPMLAGEGREYREQLLSLGLEIAPGNFGKGALHEYIATARPGQKARCVDRMGWHGQIYIGASETWGSASERHVLQRSSARDHVYGQRGSLVGWQDKVARYAVGNTRLVLAISTAFAATLLYPTGSESGGFHFRGASSTGKTTALRAAGSVWGGADFIRSWRATSNGLEGVATMRCDGLLCLDEMSQADGKDVGQTAYMLANGQGKSRANISGGAREASRFRLLFISSGEIGLADKIAEQGNGRQIAAGQAVRVLDISADAGARLGLFENLHDFPSAKALADHIQRAADENYGEPIRAFLTALMKDVTAIDSTVKRYRDDFIGELDLDGSDGQVRRAADRFGLVAAAGEMATEFGVLPWKPGEAIKAATRCFRDWLQGRGGTSAAEEISAVAAVRRFITAHGSSRFEAMGELVPKDRTTGEPIDQKVINRVGFRRLTKGGKVEYLVLPAVWSSEICLGMDPGFVAKVLAERGLLAVEVEERDGKRQVKRQVKRHIPHLNDSTRVYAVSSDILGDEEPAAEPTAEDEFNVTF